MTDKLLHISDLHNQPECEAKLDYINRVFPNHTKVCTGDITHNGFQSEYDLLGDRLDGWPVCPGNHDYEKQGIFGRRKAAAERFDLYFGKQYAIARLPWITELRNCVLIGLNSNPSRGWLGDFAKGTIGRQQLDQLDEDLDIYDHDGPIILYLHHHLQDPDYSKGFLDWFYNRAMELTDSAKLIEVIKGRVAMVLHGHRHGQYKYEVEGIPVYCAGALYNEDKALEITVLQGGKIKTQYVPVI